MKQIIIGLLVAFAFIGCSSENSITILNHAQAQVNVHFRGTTYLINSGTTYLIPDEIPNGSFNYSTVYTLPPGVNKSVEENGLSGTMTFYNRSTEITLEYGSSIDDSTSTYTIGATHTSSHFAGNP